MRKILVILSICLAGVIFITSFRNNPNLEVYKDYYFNNLESLRTKENSLLSQILMLDTSSIAEKNSLSLQINQTRSQLKKVDFWLRYLEPTTYKKINGPLPVEWETEVFEKFEKPYKREGAGLTLASLYLEEPDLNKDSLAKMIRTSLSALNTYSADSITSQLNSYHHFFLCNRLFLLNLAAIYTTGFECPDTSRVIPELRIMVASVRELYGIYNAGFSGTPIKEEYLRLFDSMGDFINKQADSYSLFNHFNFLKLFVNPLFIQNQQAMMEYKVRTKSLLDYSLNKSAKSIFDKNLYYGQNEKGIFLRVSDEQQLIEIRNLGKLLFYDPILSGNNKRSCGSCHKSSECFADTLSSTPLEFDGQKRLVRNAPSLVGAVFNHLSMLDGKHISLQEQVKDVITNPHEMASTEVSVIKKILSCPDYKKAFEKLTILTPWEPELSLQHISSAITLYYSSFSYYPSPFDESMDNGMKAEVSLQAQNGFNIFMSKAQCATCHFVPQFNGVKPPYVGSEFEVLGVPEDTTCKKISPDKGRYEINPAEETMNAFRTGSLRNIMRSAPYMHNGVFRSMEEVIDFYDAGGGIGKGLPVQNQTLASDSLHLSKTEKSDLISFLKSLDEQIPSESLPMKLPLSSIKSLNTRKVGGEY